MSRTISKLRLFLGLAVFCGLIVDAAAAQYWQGRAVVEMRISGARSGGVSGAEVDLTFLEGGADPGPAGLTTGPKGEVVLTGLAEGRWRIRVSHPDYFSFVTVVVVQIGEKVDVLEAAHEASPTGSGLLRAKFGKVKAGAGASRIPENSLRPKPVPPTAQPTGQPVAVPGEAVELEPESSPTVEISEPVVPTPAPAESEPVVEEAPTQAPAAELPAEPKESPPVAPVAPSVPQPEVPATPPVVEPAVKMEFEPVADTEPVTDPEPASESVTPVAGPVVTPVVSSVADPAPETPAEEPAVAAVGEESTVETEVGVEDAAEPTAPAMTRIPAVVRSWNNGSCNDCRPGESALSIDATVPVGGGECRDGAESRMNSLAEMIGANGGASLRSFYGPLTSDSIQPATGRFSDALAAEVEEAMKPFEVDSCQILVAVLPGSSRFTGYRYEARDFSAGGDCLPDQDCPIGSSQWLGNPGIVRGEGFTLIWARFSNRSADRVRHPRLSVYFK